MPFFTFFDIAESFADQTLPVALQHGLVHFTHTSDYNTAGMNVKQQNNNPKKYTRLSGHQWAGYQYIGLPLYSV